MDYNPDYNGNDTQYTQEGLEYTQEGLEYTQEGLEYSQETLKFLLFAMILVGCIPSLIQIINYSRKTCIDCMDNYRILSYQTIKEDSHLLLNECCICLEKYKINEKVINLPCYHNFHSKCIKIWLQRSKTCPICRENIFDITNG